MKPGRALALLLSAWVLVLSGCGTVAETSPQPPQTATTAPAPTSASSTGAGPSTVTDRPLPADRPTSDVVVAATTTGAAASPPSATASSSSPSGATSAPAVSVAGTQTNAAPYRLAAPAAGIDQAIVPMGLSAAGTISPPEGQLIWFTGYDRVAPGALGTAVIAAHVSYEGRLDVFAGLEHVSLGDPVVLTQGDGLSETFTVTSVEVYAKDELQRQEHVWGSQTHTRRLVLVTCDDELGYRADGHRVANLVVTAEPTPLR